MLSFSASHRITASEALQHAYFDDERLALSSPSSGQLSCSSANDSGTSNASSA